MRLIEMWTNKDKKELVGTITEQSNGSLYLQYSNSWNEKGFYIDPTIPLGFKGKLKPNQIEGLLERLPSKDNPRYEEHCLAWGIKCDEDDLMILLSTLGHKTVSSIEFFPKNFAPGIWGKSNRAAISTERLAALEKRIESLEKKTAKSGATNTTGATNTKNDSDK